MRWRVGTCSICGGSVMGYRGAWGSVQPPPPDTCERCGAIAAGQSDVIPMIPQYPWPQQPWVFPADGTATPLGLPWTTFVSATQP